MALKVAICVPYGGGDEYRTRNWKTVEEWYRTHHSWPIVVGDNHDDPFNIARARNDAAMKAGDWDIAVFLDADTLVHPDALVDAVTVARDKNMMVIAGNGKIYLDEHSTRLFIDTGLMFPAPTDWPDTRYQRGQYDPKSVYRDPCSGVVAVPREVWESTGGYLHNTDPKDSYEDLVFWAMCELFGGGMTRTPGVQLHLYHPVAPRYKGTNYRLYQQLARIRHRPNAKNLARQLLAPFGHEPPR